MVAHVTDIFHRFVLCFCFFFNLPYLNTFFGNYIICISYFIVKQHCIYTTRVTRASLTQSIFLGLLVSWYLIVKSSSSSQAWRWVVSGVKRTRARLWSTDQTTQMPLRPARSWATTGPSLQWWVIHLLWMLTTTATTVMLLASHPLAGRLQSWRPLAVPPPPLLQWLWTVPFPVSSQVSLCWINIFCIHRFMY